MFIVHVCNIIFRKQQPTVRDKPQKFLHKLPNLPIYSQTSKQLNTKQCVNTLLDPQLSSGSVCSRVPFDINCNYVFIIDMARLSSPKDVVCDDMGVWIWKGSYRRYLSVDEASFVEILGRSLEETPDVPYYHVYKQYYQ